MIFHMNACTGEIPELNKMGYEDLSYIVNTINEWYKVFKSVLVKCLTLRRRNCF